MKLPHYIFVSSSNFTKLPSSSKELKRSLTTLNTNPTSYTIKEENQNMKNILALTESDPYQNDYTPFTMPRTALHHCTLCYILKVSSISRTSPLEHETPQVVQAPELKNFLVEGVVR